MNEEELLKEISSLQHILGHVLLVVGEPVVVPKELLHTPLGGEWLIQMTESDDAFTFGLEKVNA